MKAYKSFKAVVNSKTPLASVFEVLDSSSGQVQSEQKQGSIVAVMTQKELESDPPEWYKRSAENDSFLADLKKTKSAWIYHGNNRILLATHDDSKETTAEKKSKALRSIAVKTTQALNAKKVTHAAFHISEEFDADNINQFVNASVLTNYKYNKKEDVFSPDTTEEEKLEKTVHPQLLENIQFCTPQSLSESQLSETEFYITAAKSALFGRDIINVRGSEADPDFMEEQIRNVAEGKNNITDIHMIKGQELQQQGLNLFYNVGKSAQSDPRLVSVYYKGNPESDQTDYAIIGKGLTYDTGGLNLKPTGYMEDMYMDKGGAVAALGALKGAIELELPVNVAFTFGIAENAIDSKSYKPGDILTSLKGLTVNVGNTDAEGRLVLADSMTWTQRKFNPNHMIDLATLTGAVMVALGNNIAGIFTNDDEFMSKFKIAGDSVYENHWHLPINDDHREIMKHDIANLSNSGKSRYAGSSTAAAFLENFVEKDTKWVHCDLAGPAYLDKPFEAMPAHGTGFGIQTLLKMLKDH
ncbi:unnamed protein product [Moneuplotes crassus]|uniref:Cytosol aminopeptidase domain-containing protein n=1 Tax=Euplotes crassus TaxID=5936 RepID=A0AAD1UD97_EUPCR|nr:unnamed protein product [Moneuplotes crassus]